MSDTPQPDSDRAAEARAEEFVESLPSVADRSTRHDSYARAGLILMFIGLALAIVAAVMSQMSNNPLDQNTQISLGIAGLAAVVTGGVVFLRYSFGTLLRYWLLRMTHEVHRGGRG